MPPQPTYPEVPTPKKKHLVLFLAVLALCGLVVAGALLWFYHPYFKAQRAVNEGEARRAILNALPENPAAKNLTFEEREQLLKGLEVPK